MFVCCARERSRTPILNTPLFLFPCENILQLSTFTLRLSLFLSYAFFLNPSRTPLPFNFFFKVVSRFTKTIFKNISHKAVPVVYIVYWLLYINLFAENNRSLTKRKNLLKKDPTPLPIYTIKSDL